MTIDEFNRRLRIVPASFLGPPHDLADGTQASAREACLAHLGQLEAALNW